MGKRREKGERKEERKEREGKKWKREKRKAGKEKRGKKEKRGREREKEGTNVGERQGRTALGDYSKITWRVPTTTMTVLKNWRIMTLGIIT